MDIFSTASYGDNSDELQIVDVPGEVQSRIALADGPAVFTEDDCRVRLCNAGLRPTRQRLVLGCLLFSGGGRHVTAEMLHSEALGRDVRLSLATVYNTLNQFTQAGLLQRIGPDGSRSFFDTNTSVHPHFYLEAEGMLLDVPEHIVLEQMPEALPGHEISRLDVIIRLRRKHS